MSFSLLQTGVEAGAFQTVNLGCGIWLDLKVCQLENITTWNLKTWNLKSWNLNLKLKKLKLKLRSESAAWWRLEPQVGAASWCHGPDGSGREGAAAGCRCAAGRLAGWQAGKGGPLEADARPLQGCWTGSRKLGFSMTHTVLSKLCICLWSSCQSLLRTNHLKLDWLNSFSSHQRSGWGSLQTFRCRLTLLSLPFIPSVASS